MLILAASSGENLAMARQIAAAADEGRARVRVKGSPSGSPSATQASLKSNRTAPAEAAAAKAAVEWQSGFVANLD